MEKNTEQMKSQSLHRCLFLCYEYINSCRSVSRVVELWLISQRSCLWFGRLGFETCDVSQITYFCWYTSV